MDIDTVRQRLYDYIRVAGEKKVKAIYTIVENEIGDLINPLGNKQVLAELDKRSAEMKSGKVKTYTLDETKQMARKRVSSKKVA